MKRPPNATPPDFIVEDNPEYDDELRIALIIGFHIRRGIQLAAAKAFEPALVEFDAAIKVCPTFGEGWLYRGLTLKQLKRFDLESVDATLNRKGIPKIREL